MLVLLVNGVLVCLELLSGLIEFFCIFAVVSLYLFCVLGLLDEFGVGFGELGVELLDDGVARCEFFFEVFDFSV